jgi:predicted small secreted protein
MDKLIIAAIVAICAGVIFIVMLRKDKCEQDGGVYVRGFWGYECIDRSSK